MIYLSLTMQFIAILTFVFIALQTFYLLIFSVAGKFTRSRHYPHAGRLASFVIYIPSYKEDAVIVDTALSALMLDYPADRMKIVVVADSLMPKTLEMLRAMPIQVVEVHFEKSTKAKALNQALSVTEGNFDYALVLDADNICAKDFLYQVNDVCNTGARVIQGQRVAANTQTSFALLDAISEGINNHIFRKGHRALGLSSAIIGSGMALSYDLFKQIMPEITAVGGFDKEMELRLLKQRIKFEYAENAVVYDEKTSQKAVFENQRRRWLSAQVHYLRRYFKDGLLELLKGNIDFFDKVVQTLLLPRILMLGITPVLFFLSLIPGEALPPIYWLTLMIATYTAVWLAVPVKYIDKRLFNALLKLPVAFLSIVRLLFKLKGANKSFIHTPHGVQ